MPGTFYQYAVCGYASDSEASVTGDGLVYGTASETVKVMVAIQPPAGFTATGLSQKVIRLTWQESAGAQGYQICRSTKETTGYKTVKTIKKGSTVKFDNKKLKPSIVYYYKIRSYRKVDGKTLYSEYSEPIAAVTLIKAPKLKSVKAISNDTVTVKWKKSAGAAGYFIYRSTKKKSGYKKVKTVKGGGSTSAQVKGNESGKKYYFKVVAYGNKKLKKTYSADSKIIAVTMNLLAYEKETYAQKCKRIFGKKQYVTYASAEEAEKHMTSVTVAVWDFGKDGVTKVTKYKTFKVHKNIAPTVKQIFEEIYNGQEKFPIKAVGGYSWRGSASSSEHNQGLAIDINPDENYMIDNGTILSGKLYEPGVNPYSIPTNGEVAKIFKKYGFSQGLWPFKNRYDYMHFSYFGT